MGTKKKLGSEQSFQNHKSKEDKKFDLGV